MQREIKFRARNANLPRCWIYGYFAIEHGECFIINNEGRFKVIAGTEGQLAGLFDKNSKEIYEGDILKWSSPLVDRRWIVEATDGGWNPFIDNMQTDGPWHYEVIGNIHEHPELLEE